MLYIDNYLTIMGYCSPEDIYNFGNTCQTAREALDRYTNNNQWSFTSKGCFCDKLPLNNNELFILNTIKYTLKKVSLLNINTIEEDIARTIIRILSKILDKQLHFKNEDRVLKVKTYIYIDKVKSVNINFNCVVPISTKLYGSHYLELLKHPIILHASIYHSTNEFTKDRFLYLMRTGKGTLQQRIIKVARNKLLLPPKLIPNLKFIETEIPIWLSYEDMTYAELISTFYTHRPRNYGVDIFSKQEQPLKDYRDFYMVIDPLASLEDMPKIMYEI